MILLEQQRQGILNRHKVYGNKLDKNNQIYISHYEGWYSVRDEAFYQENELKKINEIC